jgi:hypothetical protein
MAETEKEKLRVLLNYWIEHNEEHGDEFKEWAQKAQSLHWLDIQKSLSEASQQMVKTNQFLLSALKSLDKK